MVECIYGHRRILKNMTLFNVIRYSNWVAPFRQHFHTEILNIVLCVRYIILKPFFSQQTSIGIHSDLYSVLHRFPPRKRQKMHHIVFLTIHRDCFHKCMNMLRVPPYTTKGALVAFTTRKAVFWSASNAILLETRMKPAPSFLPQKAITASYLQFSIIFPLFPCLLPTKLSGGLIFLLETALCPASSLSAFIDRLKSNEESRGKGRWKLTNHVYILPYENFRSASPKLHARMLRCKIKRLINRKYK